MRILREESSIFVYWEDLVYLEAALIAYAQYPALVALVTGVLNGFPGVLKSDLASRRTQVQAEAQVTIADVYLDLGIREVHADSVHAAGGNKQATSHTTLFATDIGNTVRHALGKQVEIGTALVEKLVLNLFTPEFRERQQNRLGGLLDAGRAALARRRAVTIERASVRLTIIEWKEEANAVRLGVYGELLKLGGSKAFADRFFRPEPASRRTTTEDPIEA